MLILKQLVEGANGDTRTCKFQLLKELDESADWLLTKTSKWGVRDLNGIATRGGWNNCKLMIYEGCKLMIYEGFFTSGIWPVFKGLHMQHIGYRCYSTCNCAFILCGLGLYPLGVLLFILLHQACLLVISHSKMAVWEQGYAYIVFMLMRTNLWFCHDVIVILYSFLLLLHTGASLHCPSTPLLQWQMM